MPLTLLLDLDDTLLDSNIDVFIPAYFKKLAGFLAGRVDPEKFVRELLAGTDRMFKNRRPDLTLEEVFNAYFYPALGVEQSELQPEIERFYDDVFPSLREVCAPRPEAVAMVDCAFEKGWQVVIATNPLFPRKAIEHRLRWANLPPEKYPFALVTSMENSHFTKAAPAYYAEILGKLGWPSGPLIMVGDDPTMDMQSASAAGLPVFWIRPEGKSLPELQDTPQGTVAGFCRWIETVDLKQLNGPSNTPAALSHSLCSTPAVLDHLTRSLAPAAWTARPARDEWALVEIVCHLRDLDSEVNLPRLQALTSQENAFILGQDTDPWALERAYIGQDGLLALRDFVAARLRLLDALEGLSPQDWQRKARHTIFGPTDLQELVGFMVEHDRTHIRQALALV